MAIRISLPYNWNPRGYQQAAWDHMSQNLPGLRSCLVWHRRAGKDSLALNMLGIKSQQRIGTYWHLLPTYKQARSIIWNGYTKEGRSFLDHFPRPMVENMYSADMRVHFKNGSIYQCVGTDDIDSLVGTNPIGVVLSEFSLHDPRVWDFLRPILRENGGWAMFIYTPRGRNHGYRLYQMARNNPDWFCQRLTIGDTKRDDGTPVICEEDVAKDRAEGMSQQLVNQEYYVDFEAPMEGAYYATQMEAIASQKRVTKVPYEPRLPVDTAWDIGGDATAIGFFQRTGSEHRMIDYYERSGEALPHYVKAVLEKPYVYRKHFAPWDIAIKEFSTGKTRLEVARLLGIRFVTTGRHEVADGIEQCRSILPQMWIDEEHCQRFVEAMKSYRKQQLPEQRGYTSESGSAEAFFSEEPIHDWSSHPADMFRYYCWNQKIHTEQNDNYGTTQKTAIDEYRYA